MSFSACDSVVDEDDVDIFGRSSSSPEPNIFDVKSDIWSSSGPLSFRYICWYCFVLSRFFDKGKWYFPFWDDEDVIVESASSIVDDEQ